MISRTPIVTASLSSGASGICHGAEGMSWVARSTPWRMSFCTEPMQMASSRRDFVGADRDHHDRSVRRVIAVERDFPDQDVGNALRCSGVRARRVPVVSRSRAKTQTPIRTYVGEPSRLNPIPCELCDANAVIFRIEDGAKLSVRSLSFKL